MSKCFHYAAIAGAGTGKTYSLVENYLCALFGLDDSEEKKRPQEILALTFTEKAANEMRLRITKRISGLLYSRPYDDPLLMLAKEKNCDLPGSDEIRRILRALPHAPIATFHGFCAQLLRYENKAIGIDDRFAILSVKEELLLARNVLRPIIIAEIKHNAVVRSLVARFRLGANFSSLGLVDGLLQVYFKLTEKNIDCENVESLTRSNRVTKSMLHDDFAKVKIAFYDFKNNQASLKTRERMEKIEDILFRLANFENHNEIEIAAIFKELRINAQGNFGEKITRQAFIKAIAALASHMVDYFLFSDEIALARLLKHFHDEFNNTKRDALKFSYADLLTLTHHALLKNLSLRQKIKKRFRHILVDEYQDTSPIQENIVALLGENKSEEKSFLESSSIIDNVSFKNGSSFFIVGDPKQSIYGFRGADVSLFDRMVNKMAETHDDDKMFFRKYLTKNHRSQKKVLNLVNLVSEHCLKHQGYSQEHALIPIDHENKGNCALWVLKSDEDLPATSANLRCAVFGIVDLLSTRKDLRPLDIVVLVRRIKSATTIKRQLSSFNVPSHIIGGEGFFQQQEIVDLLSALKLINNPQDPLACAVVLRSPLVLLKDQEIFSVASNSSYGLSLLGARELLESGALSKMSAFRVKRFYNVLEEARLVLKHENLGRVIDIIVDRCDFASVLGLYDDAHQKWANVQKLKIMLSQINKNPFVAIEEFYAHINEPSKEPLASTGSKKDAVTIMTIHQSKGLEFKVVVLADTESHRPIEKRDVMVDGSGIMIRAKNRPIEICSKIFSRAGEANENTRYEIARKNNNELEEKEAARILYVALTRAKEEVYVASSMNGFSSTKEENNLLSMFLRPYREVPVQFQEICGIEFKEIPKPLNNQFCERVAINTVTLKKKPGAIRLFASTLEVRNKIKWQHVVMKQRLPKLYARDGALAHKLVAQAGPAVFNGRTPLSAIDQLLSALLRSMTDTLFLEIESTLEAVKTTLFMLKKNLPFPVQALFEMALSTWPNPRVKIEGFADLVLVTNDFVGVVEFKSSLKNIHDVNTYFQVFAYAHALRRQFNRPIKCAVLMFGASSKIKWHDYDDRFDKLFVDEFSDFPIGYHDNILAQPVIIEDAFAPREISIS